MIDEISTLQAAGTNENLTISGLTPGELYYFTIRAQDEVSNLGDLSNSPNAVPIDNTAPGDDGSFGMAESYLVRYSSSKILTEDDWDAATVVISTIPVPQTAGLAENMVINKWLPHRRLPWLDYSLG